MKRLLGWLALATSLFFVLACGLPVASPLRYVTIEDSWIQVLHLAFVQHLQFGREIVFTFGPWGFLYGGYRPETHLISVLVWLGLAIVFWWAGWRVAELAFENRMARWLWLMGITSFTAVTTSLNIDARLISFPLLLLVLHYLDEGVRKQGVRNALLVSMGLLSLVKFTVLILSIGIIVAMAVETVWRKRRFPWDLPVFIGAILSFWLLAGQRLGSFGPYLRTSWEMTVAFSEAMMITGPHEGEFVGGFILLAAAMVASVATGVWKRLGYFALLPLGAIAFTLFIIFKYGFVRDDRHEAVAAALVQLVSLMCLAITWPADRERRGVRRFSSLVPLVAACLFAGLSFRRCEEPPFIKQWAETFLPEKWLAPIELLYNGGQLRQTYNQRLSDYRKAFPLPPLDGDADLYFCNQIKLFANGARYHPRPVFQSYSAYTPGLAALNADYLRSEGAAQSIVWDGITMDERYSSLEDGLSWPELLTRYDVQQVEASFVRLTRSQVPRHYELKKLQERTIQFGEPLSLPQTSDGPVWAEIDVERTPAGSVASMLFKPPELLLRTTLRCGLQWTRRFVPGMARSGFILSPFVEGGAEFAALASARWPDELAGNEVISFSIIPAENFPPIGCYRNSIQVRLYRLKYPRQDLAAVAGYNQTIALKEAVERAAWIQKAKLLYLPNEGSVLSVPADSQMAFDRPDAARHLRIGFGYDPEGMQNSNGITFRVLGVTDQNQQVSLWSRRINPELIPGDRGKQEATVDLGSNGISRVVLETSREPAAGSQEVYWPYWFEIRFE